LFGLLLIFEGLSDLLNAFVYARRAGQAAWRVLAVLSLLTVVFGLILLFNPAVFPPETWHGHYGGMLFMTAWWGIWHIISGLCVSYYFRRKDGLL
jgi:BASS family bile acid:Na+ symporter